jgi:hypothetical protein
MQRRGISPGVVVGQRKHGLQCESLHSINNNNNNNNNNDNNNNNNNKVIIMP